MDKNGCGGSWTEWVPEDPFWQGNFHEACNRHDTCYGTCNSNKLQCDIDFLKDMIAVCASADSGGDCAAFAVLYWAAVSAFGQSGFEEGQRKACCCDDPQPQQSARPTQPEVQAK